MCYGCHYYTSTTFSFKLETFFFILLRTTLNNCSFKFCFIFREARKDSRNKTVAQPSNSDILNQSDKLDDEDDRKDYDNLLKRLEKPARNTPTTKPSLLTNDLMTKVNSNQSYSMGGSANSPVSTGSSGFSEPSMTTPTMSSDPKAKLKSKRRPHATGGPVISSGLAGKRDLRLRPGSGRLSNSLSALNNGSLFGDDEVSKEQNVAQTQKLDAQDNHVSTNYVYVTIYDLSVPSSNIVL